MKTITDTFVFSFIDNQSNLKEKIIKFIQDSEKYNFDNELLDDAYREIRKMKYNTKDEILKYVKEGKIIMAYYDNEQYKLPVVLPFIKVSNRDISIVNISNICRGGIETVDVRKLYSLLEGALLQLKTIEYGQMIAKRYSSKKITVPVKCYVKLFTNLLNVNFSIAVNQVTKSQIEFMIAKFCMLSVMGTEITNNDMDRFNNTVLSIIDNPVNMSLIESVDAKFIEDDYKNISTFIKALAQNIGILSKLNISHFLSTWANSYGSPSLLSIEYFPYLIFMITSTLRGSNILSQYKIEPHISRYQYDIEEFILSIIK